MKATTQASSVQGNKDDKQSAREKAALSIVMGEDLKAGPLRKERAALFSGRVIALFLIAAVMIGFVTATPHHRYVHEWGNKFLQTR